ncbi:protein adenylyltransferase Fic-like [Apostichopus japonicus]|uniref:protein adenylyltransferase Fic-like n=1 Tax=Stichopus japonicus TaxID=307972 RepID=UPI003AB4CDCD
MCRTSEIHITVNRSSLVCFLFGGIMTAVLLSAFNTNYLLSFPGGWSRLRKHVVERALLVPGIGSSAMIPVSNPLMEWALTGPKLTSEPKVLKGETLAALHQAIDAKERGKKEKALKLFQHALALDPSHSDVLNEYGEFLEEDDIVKADHLYTCAVLLNDSHPRALSNLRRTSNKVAEIDKEMFDKIDRKLAQFFEISESSRVFERARQEFYYLQIYHTTAIEGNTLTLEQMRSIMETGLAIGGKSILEHNEVLGLDAALQFINNTLMQRIGAITVRDILAIHQRVMGYVDPIDAGHVRTTQVFIGGHVPPPSTEVEELMDEFVEWLNSEEALLLHPVEFAALAHYKFVYIHPFADGNGRTARLLMNLILMRSGYPPVILKLSERHTYYEVIKKGNMGDIRPFIRFISQNLDAMLHAYIYLDEDRDHSIAEVKDKKDVTVIDGG